MGALWSSDDAIKRDRMNRIALPLRLLGVPMYDVDGADVVQVTAKPNDGVLLGATVAAHYTAPATAGSVVQVHALTLRNTHSADLAVELYLVPSGGTAGVPERIFDDTVPAGVTTILAPVGGWFLGASGTIRGKAGTASLVALRAEITEYASQPAGLTLKVVDGVQLATTYSTIYAVPATGVRHALLLNYTLCNTDSVDRAPTVAIIESGDTASAEDEIFGDTMFSKETVIDDAWRILEPSDFIQAKNAAAANVMSARVTMLEVA